MAQFVSDRMPYLTLSGRLCHIIVLKVDAPKGDKIDYVKNSFYEELERVFDTIPTYHMKFLIEDFNSEVGWEDILKPTIDNKSLREIINDNGFRVVSFTTFKNLVAKCTMFPHSNIHKYTWASPDGNIHNQIYHIHFMPKILKTLNSQVVIKFRHN
jgi:hypothetical protein